MGILVGVVLVVIAVTIPWIRVSGLKTERGKLDTKISELRTLLSTATGQSDQLRARLKASEAELDRMEGERAQILKAAADRGVDPGDLWDDVVRKNADNPSRDPG